MKLDPKQKKMAAVAGGGALLGLVVLLARGGAGGASSATDPSGQADTGGVADPSSFADNGAAMGQLSSDITGQLGDVATALQGFSDRLGNQDPGLSSSDVAAGVTAGLGSFFASQPTEPAANGAPGLGATTGQPAGTAKSSTGHVSGASVVAPATHAASSAGALIAGGGGGKVNTTSNQRAGQTYKTVTEKINGKTHTVHVYGNGQRIDMGVKK